MAEFRKRTVRVSNEGKVFELEIDDELQSQISKTIDGEEIEEGEPEQSFLELPDDHFIWTRKATLLLINSRLEMDNDFINPTVKKSILWQRIANILKQNSYIVQGSKCDIKWRTLLQTYRKIKRRKGGRASGWQYFPVIDQAMKNRIQMLPQKDRKIVRLSDMQKRKRTVESDCFSSDSCYSDAVHETLTQHERSRSRPEIIRVQSDGSGRIFEANNNRNYHQPLRIYSSAVNVPITGTPRVQIENPPRVQHFKVENTARVQGENDSRIRVPVQIEEATPPWLNLVMHKLEERDKRRESKMEERDKRSEERESERWNNLLCLVESHRQVELEKVKAITNLTDMLQQYINQKLKST